MPGTPAAAPATVRQAAADDQKGSDDRITDPSRRLGLAAVRGRAAAHRLRFERRRRIRHLEHRDPDITIVEEPGGTLVIDDEEHAVTVVHCHEGDGWRVVAEFDGGDATFDQDGGAAVDLGGARAWSQSSGDDVTPITVDGDGAHGQTWVYSAEDTDELVVLQADVRC